MNDVCVCGKPVVDGEEVWGVPGSSVLHDKCGRELWTDGPIR